MMSNYWKIIESHYENRDLTALQLESYNKFATDSISDIVQNQYVNISLSKSQTFVICFQNVYVNKPYVYSSSRNKQILYPDEARDRDLSYETIVTCDIELILLDKKTNAVLSSHTHRKVELFKLPVMVNSCICNLKKSSLQNNEDIYNNGGYFIIKGKERVLVAQERINYNHIYVFKQKNKYRYIAEIRSIKESADYSVLLQSKIQNDDQIVFSIPYITQDIPVSIVFVALGSSLEFLQYHCSDYPDVCLSLMKSFQPYIHMSKEDCIEYISNFTLNKVDEIRKIRYTQHILQNEILPHLGVCAESEVKVLFLLKMIIKMIRTDKGQRMEDDRDHICNKRIEMVGDLLTNIINSLFKRSIKSVQQYIEKREEISKIDDINIINILNRFNITQRLYYCFTTGNWGLPKSNYIRQGVSQVLSRLSYLGTISHLRRVVVPIGKESRNTQVRQIHPSNYGFVDPIETPEGQQVGIIRNFSILTKISNKISTSYVIDIIDQLFTHIPREFRISNNYFRIIVSGIWIGSIEIGYITEFIDKFKYFRCIDVIPYSISISVDHDDREIIINSDSGRLLRPVIDVKKIELLNTYIEKYSVRDLWKVLLDQNIIIYIDGGEAESSVIAMRPEDINTNNIKYDYCEIHPCAMLGICSNTTPFPEHSQSPRNVYVAAMMKQAIGMYSLSHNCRFDTIAHVLNYPQKKLITTKIAQYTHCEDMPSGSEVILAVMCYTGFNQEDSILMKKSAIDRGLFNSVSYKTTSTNESKKGTHDSEIVELVPSNLRNFNYNYSKLDARGIIKKGSIVSRNDVLVGKVYYNKDVATSDCSLICKASEEGIIDRILETTNSSGYKHIKIKIRKICIPEIGDKFCQVSAQKGTIGMIYREEDMPFTSDGITPDIIINPNAIPSRMTINMLLEMLCGKVGCFSGEIHDASAFEHDGEKLVNELGDKLKDMGYNRMGTEIMYNGFTGEPFKANIYIGPAYYQRLKHLVANKIHARSFGNVQLLSRQPCAGRAREGGLRYGEMEKDCAIVHGTSSFLKERLFDMSDPYQIHICPMCGSMVNAQNNCMICEHDQTIQVYIPYACKLLFQELQAMGVKINVKPTE